VEATEILSKHAGTVHLVLSDVVMPKMGGKELVERLRTTRPGTKVVLMSGYSDYSNGFAGQPSSQALFLQKPFSRRSLVEKVREALAGSSVEQTSGVRAV
jgi:two-component system cell cycle sensor histidine kinase/response regulator CckA